MALKVVNTNLNAPSGYPGAGIANSTGSAWGTSYTTTGTGTVLALQTTPTFNTNITAPLVIGGTTASASLKLESTSGAGTTDSIQFLTGSQSVRMTIDTSGNVGIGTASPDALLTVNTIASFGDGAVGAPSIAHKGDLNTGIWFPASDTIAASTAGVERIRITSGGNVGIGATPSVKLHVNAGGTAEVARFESTNPYISLYDAGVRQAYFYSDSGAIRLYAEASKPLYLFASGAQQVAIGTNNSERLRVDSSGNLLIGTTTAGASKLVVNDSSIQINTAKTPASATDTGTTGQVCWDASYIYVCTTTNTWKRAAIATW